MYGLDEARTICTLSLKLSGVVQGVGMRPYIYNKAIQHNLTGWVKNSGNHVEVVVQGKEENIQQFSRALHNHDLALAIVKNIKKKKLSENRSIDSFSILESEKQINLTHSIKDYAICAKCKKELLAENNKRFLYPFTSCTDCGPRYAIMSQYPLDRKNTSFNAFTPCASCAEEYNKSDNRRFHAQNICCEKCGPHLYSDISDKDRYTGIEIIKQCIELLTQGKIIALKSSSGYKLICDAGNFSVVDQLRKRKNRAHKPFAVMFPDLDSVKRLTKASENEIRFIAKKENPVLLVNKLPDALPNNISPYLSTIGACLPGTALEFILLHQFGKPVIYTSGNIANQPITTNAIQAEAGLKSIADYFVHHNLKIHQANDDSIWHNIDNKLKPLRLGKGYAPLEITLPHTLKHPIIALGAQMKNTVAIAWSNRVVISPHIGDTGDYNNWSRAMDQVEHLLKLYNVNAITYLIDSHNGFSSSQWVRKNSLTHRKILHHHAHASAVAAVMPDSDKNLVFTWDGTGLGENGQLWGGETFLGKPGNWSRVASLDPFSLPGAEAAIKQPWRSAASLLWQCGINYDIDDDNLKHVHMAWQEGINAPQTSSIGRLFDGAAAIIGLLNRSSFEGQAATMLEACATDASSDFISISLAKIDSDLYIAGWKRLVAFMADKSFSTAYRATVFHNSLAQLILNQCLLFRRLHKVNNIGLSGGVFQNKKLTGLTVKLLNEHKFGCYLNEDLPCNDAHISYGQTIEYLYQEKFQDNAFE